MHCRIGGGGGVKRKDWGGLGKAELGGWGGIVGRKGKEECRDEERVELKGKKK
jgi:hypothetical protein